MQPTETLNDFIANQVAWMSDFREHYMNRIFRDKEVPDEMLRSEWMELFRKWYDEETGA